MNSKFRLAFCAAALLTLCAGGLNAGTAAYTLTSDGLFGTTDLNTGAFSSIGNPGTYWGLGVADGVLYADWGDELYSIDLSDGSASLVGADASMGYRYFGSTTGGLYALGYDSASYSWGNLFSINPANGTATLIGQTGLYGSGPGNLSTNSSTLYFSQGGNLYTIDTTTGAAALVGSTGDALLGAMLWDGGVLYAGESWPTGNNTVQLDTLDTATGAATAGPSFSYSQYGAIIGLAPDPLTTVPEPSAMVLLGLGGVALFAAGRRSRAAFPARK